MEGNVHAINNFAVLCDENGNILSRISDGVFEKNLQIGNNLCEFIDLNCSEKYFKFLEIIKKEGYVIDYEINFFFNDNNFCISLNGVYEDERIYVIGLFHSSELGEILKDILKMNSLYITQLRNNIKNNYLNAKNLDESVYTEISRLNNELVNSKRVIEQQNAKLLEYTKSLEDLALKDSLTGAYNRRCFNRKINEEIEKIRKIKSQIVLAVIDFDNFKIVNDKLGHLAGDELLQNFMSICDSILRKDLDFVFRFGGDEFLIMSLNINQEKQLEVIEKINSEFKKYTKISELSYGIVEITLEKINDDFNIDNCLKEVDEKMYFFKRNKKVNHEVLLNP